MTTPQTPTNSLGQKTLNWAQYNARILQIRDKFFVDQQSLRSTRDAAVKTAQDLYNVELAKLSAKYELDVAAARKAFAGQ